MSENNENLPANKRPLEVGPPLTADEMAPLPAWLVEMRAAISEQLSPGVLKDVIGKQVEKAKSGDLRAAGFVMDQAHKLMSGETGRRVSITQNNHYKSPAPAERAAVVLPSGKPYVTAEERARQRRLGETQR